jgi:type III secretory pathway component EscS
MELFYNLLPILFSFLLGLVVYLVKAILDLSHRVLALELKIEILLKEIERLRFDKEDFKDKA